MHTLLMQLDDGDGTLLRVLSTTWRRGWQLIGVNFEAPQVRLTVAGERSVELLTRQLDRLTDVRSVQVLS